MRPLNNKHLTKEQWNALASHRFTTLHGPKAGEWQINVAETAPMGPRLACAVDRTLIQRLPHEHTVYLGDTARVPYGTRSGEVVTRYALLSARHLASYGIKLLVVACNTVSAHSLHALADALPIPVVGVIEPGAQAAAARTRGGTIVGVPQTI